MKNISTKETFTRPTVYQRKKTNIPYGHFQTGQFKTIVIHYRRDGPDIQLGFFW